MKLLKWILYCIVGGLIGSGLVMGFGSKGALLILVVLLLTAGLYGLDQYYLEKGPRVIK